MRQELALQDLFVSALLFTKSHMTTKLAEFALLVTSVLAVSNSLVLEELMHPQKVYLNATFAHQVSIAISAREQ